MSCFIEIKTGDETFRRHLIGLRILWRNRKKDKEKYLKDKCECFISADDENEGTYLIKQENTEEKYYGFSQQIHTSGLENTWRICNGKQRKFYGYYLQIMCEIRVCLITWQKLVNPYLPASIDIL